MDTQAEATAAQGAVATEADDDPTEHVKTAGERELRVGRIDRWLDTPTKSAVLGVVLMALLMALSVLLLGFGVIDRSDPNSSNYLSAAVIASTVAGQVLLRIRKGGGPGIGDWGVFVAGLFGVLLALALTHIPAAAPPSLEFHSLEWWLSEVAVRAAALIAVPASFVAGLAGSALDRQDGP